MAIETQYVPPHLINDDGSISDMDEAKRISAAVKKKANALPPADRALFLALMKNEDLFPEDAWRPDKVQETLLRLEGAAVAFRQLLDGGRLEDFTRVLLTACQQQDMAAMQGRNLARQHAAADALAQAQAQRDSASKGLEQKAIQLAVAVTFAIVQIGVSLLSVKSAAGSASKSTKAVAAQKGAEEAADAAKVARQQNNPFAQGMRDDANKQAVLAKELNDEAAKLAQNAERFGSAAGMAKSLGQTGGANAGLNAEHQAKRSDAEATEKSAMVQHNKAEAESDEDMRKAHRRMIEQTIQFLKDMADAKVGTLEAVTRASKA